MTKRKLFLNGLFYENPIFVQLLSLCPLLAVTTSGANALTLGLSTTGVLICTSAVISLVRRFIPGDVRIASFIVIVAGVVTVLQLLLAAFAPVSINESLGIYIPLIVVNCVVFARLEIFASKNNVIDSVADALGMGLGLTGALLIIGIIREFFANGTFFGIVMQPDTASHMLIMGMAPGAFFTLGIVIMVIKHLQARGEN
jgi:electron transport complex protein RnfE